MKTVLITGANKSIGFETARQLLLQGYHVYLGCRDLQKGQQAVDQLKADGLTNVEPIENDVDMERMGVLNHPLAVEGGGYSMIYGPDGRPLVNSLPPTEEGTLYAELELGLIWLAKAFADPVGHYARPDIFHLRVERSSKPKIEFLYEDHASVLKTEPLLVVE